MEDFFQIKKTEINLGLDREYKFFQISDIHMSYVYEDSTQEEINESIRTQNQWYAMKREFASAANEFCDERYDVPPHLIFEKLAKYAIDIKADAFVFTGDMFNRVTDSNIRYMKDFLKDFPIPIIYCPGNHCSMNINGEHVNLYDKIKDVIPNPSFASYEFDDFSILTFDNGEKKITCEQLDFLKEKLNGEKKVLIVVHAPLNIGEFGKEYVKKLSPYFFLGVEGDCENAFKFNEIIKENDEKIIAVLAGHIHSFAQGKLTDNLMQYVCSSALIGAGREIIIK